MMATILVLLCLECMRSCHVIGLLSMGANTGRLHYILVPQHLHTATHITLLKIILFVYINISCYAL